MVTSRRGAGSLGCLFSAAVAAVVIYFGVNIGGAYWRYYEFQDDMKQLVEFAPRTSNENLVIRLRASADSLELPDDAKQIVVRRTETLLSIDAEYDEHIELPMYVRDIHFHPHADGPL